MRSWQGTTFAIAGVWLGGLLVVLATMLLTAAARLPLLATVAFVFTSLGLAACVVWMMRLRISRPRHARVEFFAAALVGPVVWLAFAVPTAIVNPTAGRSWAMHGDAANYLLFARGITTSMGIVVGPANNPVPLPSGLLAIAMAPGRDRVAPAQLLWHDLGSYESVQILVVAASCLFAGLLAAWIAKSTLATPGIVIATAAFGSLLPLSWTLTTDALAYGYFDALLALPSVFACLIVGRIAPERPVAALGLLALGSTVILAVWTPLILVPIATMCVVCVTEWSALKAARGISLAVLVACLLQLVLYGVVVTLPSFFAQSQYLAAHGAAFSYPHSLFPSLGAMTILLSILAWIRVGVRQAISTIVLALTLALGLLFLLYEARKSGQAWSYYPSKFEWLSIAILLVVALGLLPVIFATILSGRALQIAAVISLASMTGIVVTSTPNFVDGYDWGNPLTWIAQKSNAEGGSAAAKRVLDAADLEHPRLYWQSNVPFEFYVDYWLIEVASKSIDNNALRKFAYAHNESSITQLCTILGLMHPTPTVLTTNPSLAKSLAATCPATPVHVRELVGAGSH